MAVPHRSLCLCVLAAAVAAAEQGEPTPEDEVTALVQLSLRMDKKSSQEEDVVGALIADLDAFALSGRLSAGMAPTEQCGRARYQDLTMTLRYWREQHPNADGYCYFQNMAWWLQGAGSVSDYRTGMAEYVDAFGDAICAKGKAQGGLVARGAGPSASMAYDGGNLTWAHLDTCLDVGDDPYCYSLGWLKGQRLDGALLTDNDAWEALARSECERIQQTYRFLDEEVTVANHIHNTARYLRGAGCAMRGGCPAVDRRLHNQHVYTKCLLGGGRAAAAEMSYCYHKGCVLPDGRIDHQAACNYN